MNVCVKNGDFSAVQSSSLIMPFSIYECLRKKWRVQRRPIKFTLSLLNKLKYDVLAPVDYHLILGIRSDLDD